MSSIEILSYWCYIEIQLTITIKLYEIMVMLQWVLNSFRWWVRSFKSEKTINLCGIFSWRIPFFIELKSYKSKCHTQYSISEGKWHIIDIKLESYGISRRLL